MEDESEATLVIDLVQTEDVLKFPEDGLPEIETETERIYTFTHPDGRESKGTLDEIRGEGGCPIIGKMAVEEARQVLEKSVFAQRIAERGRVARLAKEQAGHQDGGEKNISTNKSELVVKKTTEHKHPNQEATVGMTSPSVVADLRTQIDISAVRHYISEDTNQSTGEVREVPKKVNVRSPLVQQNISKKSDVAPVFSASLVSEIESKTINTLNVVNIQAGIVVDNLPEVPETTKPEVNALIEGFGNDVGELTDEATETYEQIIVLEDEVKDHIVAGEAETPEVETFEEFINSQPQPEEFISLETIKSNANEQTLDETLVQLVSFLSEAARDAEDSVNKPETGDSQIIKQLLKEIEEELAKPLLDGLEEFEAVCLTPEVTQKLLTLLRTIGYQNPQEVLVDFVSKYDLEFLTQAMRYLYQLTNEESRHEFLIYKTSAPLRVNNDHATILRLSKTILLGFIRSRHLLRRQVFN